MAYFRTLVGWPVKDSILREQCIRLGMKDLDEGVGYITRIRDLIRNLTEDRDMDLSLERQEDRRKKGGSSQWILTIYEGSRREGEVDVNTILRKYPPIFETIKKDLGISGPPKYYLGEP